MSLPTTDAIAFRGNPSLGDKATVALLLTLTSKQVEALFARHEAINKVASESATQSPLEIDFVNKKLYIGDTTTSFTSAKETGILEVCQRTPSATKPSTDLFRSATVVGKITIPRELDDAASDLRKATEAERTKKNERGIVRIDVPFPAPKLKGKRTKLSGAISLIKKAAANRALSSQTNFPMPRPVVHSASTNSPKPSPSRPSAQSTTLPTRPNVHPVSTNSSKLSSSRPSPLSAALPITSASTRDPDVNTLRSRLIHFIAASARPKEVAIAEFISDGRGRVADNEAGVRKLFDQVAQEIPGPRSSDSNYWIWDLKSYAWLEVEPSNDTPDQACRRTRIGSAGMLFRQHSPTNVKGKKNITKPSTPNFKVASTSKRKLEEDEDLRPRKLPPVTAIETKLQVEVRSSSSPTSITSSKLGTSKKAPSPKPPVPANNFSQKRKLADLGSEPSSELEEGEIPEPKEMKKHRIIGLPKASKPKEVTVAEKVVSPSAPRCDRELQRAKIGASSSRNSSKLSKPEVEATQGKGKGKEPMRTDDACHIEDKKGSTVKHRRKRETPVFSSDEEDGELRPQQRVPAIPLGRPSTTTSAPGAGISKERSVGSATLPDDKERLKHEYGRTFAQCLHLFSIFNAQKARVEAALSLPDEASIAEEDSPEEDSELMDTEELVQLCHEFYGIREELAKIHRAHRRLNVGAL